MSIKLKSLFRNKLHPTKDLGPGFDKNAAYVPTVL